ncbi:MAG: fibronectin type III domain-containing protein [Candidatus Omnitrophica bacterium]|nr:fibronectin type III domain-containing protein [Candidatus Omnitrophota bacterium]
MYRGTSKIDTIAADSISYTDVSVLNFPNNYSYKVRAYNQIGYSDYSNTVYTASLRPATPSKLILSKDPASRKPRLSWQDKSSNEEGFKIWRSGREIASTTANVNTYIDTNAISGRRYYYRVRAFNRFGYSNYSNLVY